MQESVILMRLFIIVIFVLPLVRPGRRQARGRAGAQGERARTRGRGGSRFVGQDRGAAGHHARQPAGPRGRRRQGQEDWGGDSVSIARRGRF